METNSTIPTETNTSFLSSIEKLLQRKPVVLQLLRFACIGALNTALDFLFLNLLTEWLGIQSGVQLAVVNVVGVVAAIFQSYYWNKHWAFATGAGTSLLKQFIGLVLVGGLGFAAFVAAVLPSLSGPLEKLGLPTVSGSVLYYGLVLLVFLLVQIVIGVNIGFKTGPANESGTTQFGKFVAVSVIGVIINSLVLTVLVAVITAVFPSVAESLAKNVAKFAAVFVSLTWNFIGYKFFVFRK